LAAKKLITRRRQFDAGQEVLMKGHAVHVSIAALLLFLTACQGGSANATPTPSGPPEPVAPVVSATGEVVPESWADLSLPTAGVVDVLAFDEGDSVKAGDVILRLSGRQQLQAQLASAQQELVAAQQALDDVYDQADVVRAQAQSDLAYAREDLRAAEYQRSVRQPGNRASKAVIAAQEGKVYLAKKDLDQAKRRANGERPDDHDSANAAINLSNAQQAYDAAVRTLNWYTGKPTDIQQGMLDADVAIAEAKVAAAEKALSDVQDGPDPEVLAQAQARLASAKAGVDAAEAALSDCELRAPFDGVVAETRVRAGEWISPGQVVVSLADLKHLQVETTDLDEIDAAKVSQGAKATVTFDALPDVEVAGSVMRVAPRAAQGSGVNFTAVVSLDQVPTGLRWGMTAYVDIDAQTPTTQVQPSEPAAIPGG
jgi:multidrug efflux pump subunit AcrA (membrane-fusion protein)